MQEHFAGWTRHRRGLARRLPRICCGALTGAPSPALRSSATAKERRKVYYYASEAKVRMPTFRMGNVICRAQIAALSTGSNSRRPRDERLPRPAFDRRSRRHRVIASGSAATR